MLWRKHFKFLTAFKANNLVFLDRFLWIKDRWRYRCSFSYSFIGTCFNPLKSFQGMKSII